MPKAVVVAESHGWREGDQTFYADQGQEITVSASELRRGEELGTLKPAEEPEARAASEGLASLSKDDLDTLAREHDVADYPSGKKAPAADKIASLEAAGVAPATAPDEETAYQGPGHPGDVADQPGEK